MKNKKILLCIALGFYFPFSALCNVYEDSYFQIKQNNLELKALEAESRSEILELMGENSLVNPEVEFDRLWGRKAEPRWGLSISQTFSFPGVYNARRNERKALKTAKEFDYEVNYIDCKLQVTELLARLSYLNHASRLQEKVVEDMEQLETLLKKAFDAGETTILDYNKARIERTNAMLVREELIKEQHQILSDLKVIGVNINPENIPNIDYPELSLKSKEEYFSSLLDDPVVNYYEALKKSKLMQAKVGQFERLPEFKVGYVHEYEDGVSFNGFSVGMSLPFFGNSRKAAASRAQALANEYKAMQTRIEREVSIEAEYSVVSRLQEIYFELAPIYKVDNNLLLLEKAFKGGELSAIEYIREVDFFRSSESTFLEIERDYYLALISLSKYFL